MIFHGNQWGCSDAVARFWAKVDRRGPDECWNWIASGTPFGYGNFWLKGKQRNAHRVSWAFEHGSLPIGCQVCHTCDNPRCVNPDHLFLGTRSDNMRDGAAKGRVGRKPGFAGPVGEKHSQARVTEKQVREIRARRAAGETFTGLAGAFGVSRGCIQGIVQRVNWSHVI